MLFFDLTSEQHEASASNETNDGRSWKIRKMFRERWRDPEADGASAPRAEKVISVKLTEAELAEFDAQIAKLGLKRNRALWIAARRIGGFVENDAETLELLRRISRTLGKVATNINQIAKAANRTHEPAYRALMEQRKSLGLELARLATALVQLVDVSQRRTDELACLREASQACPPSLSMIVPWVVPPSWK